MKEQNATCHLLALLGRIQTAPLLASMDAEIATVNREHVSLAVEKDSMDQQPLTKGHSLNLLRAMDATVLVMNVLAVALPTANPATRTTISPISIHQIRLRT